MNFEDTSTTSASVQLGSLSSSGDRKHTQAVAAEDTSVVVSAAYSTGSNPHARLHSDPVASDAAVSEEDVDVCLCYYACCADLQKRLPFCGVLDRWKTLIVPVLYLVITMIVAGANVPASGHTTPPTIAPAVFYVSFATSVRLVDGRAAPPIVLQVRRAYAPLGVDRFWQLATASNGCFYNNSGFFRVVPGFVVQFGIAGTPAQNRRWSAAIPDDPVVLSNKAGTVAYATAGPNTRTTQIFLNYADNSRLDSRGFAPFATVVSGMDTARALVNPTPGNSNGVNQTQYEKQGNPWLLLHYPNISMITSVQVSLPVESELVPET